MNAPMERNGVAGGFSFGTGFLLAGLVLGLVLGRNGGLSNRRRMSQGTPGSLRPVGSRMPDVMFRGGPAQIRGAVMQAKVPKLVGDSLTVGITWDAGTTDFNGQPIPWRYQLGVDLFSPKLGEIVQGIRVPDGYSLEGPGSHSRNLVFTALNPGLQFAGELSVNVLLLGAPSDPDGNPIMPSDPIILAEVTAQDTVIVSPNIGPSLPAGTVGAITVSQNPGFIKAYMGLVEQRRYLTPVSMKQLGQSTSR